MNADPPATIVSGERLDATGGGVNARSTVTATLFAFRASLTNNLNSYVPGVVGIDTVHARLVTPVPTSICLR